VFDLLGILASLYLGYVNDFLSISIYANALPMVMNFQRKKRVVLPKTQINITTIETNRSTPFWQHIVLLITDSWFFDWLSKETKAISSNEKILEKNSIEKNIHKSRYSRVI
jgi:hypothetical protein